MSLKITKTALFTLIFPFQHNNALKMDSIFLTGMQGRVKLWCTLKISLSWLNANNDKKTK